MIVNADTRNLLKPPPNVSEEWRERLTQWLKIVRGESFAAVYTLQRDMIDHLVALESEIQDLKSRAKALTAEIRTLKANGQLEQVRKNQQQATELNSEATGLFYTRHCVLTVGDTIAAHLLDPDTSRHFAGYQSPGFMAGKVGLKAEIEAARHFLMDGYMVLFNDLTHCLAVGDLTLKNEKGVRTFEVKSSARGYLTPEAFRQIAIPIAIHDYIRTDVSTFPHALRHGAGITKGEARLDSDIEEDWHKAIAGRIYTALRRNPIVHLKLGRKHYLACRRRRVGDLMAALDDLVRGGDWVVSNIRKRVTENAEVMPFTMWFKPESAVELMSGELVVIAAFSMADLTNLFAKKGVTLTWKREMTDLFPVHLEAEQPAIDEFELKTDNLGDHHRLKVLYGFCSIETYVDICAFLMSPEALAQFKNKMAEYKAHRKHLA